MKSRREGGRERERVTKVRVKSKSLPAGTKVMPPFPKEVHNIAPGSLILVRVLLQERERGKEENNVIDFELKKSESRDS